MHSDAPDDPLRTMTVERTLKDDGRYLLYYSWPAGGANDAEPDADEAANEDV